MAMEEPDGRRGVSSDDVDKGDAFARRSVLASPPVPDEKASSARWLIVLVPVVALFVGITLVARSLFDQAASISIAWPERQAPPPQQPSRPDWQEVFRENERIPALPARPSQQSAPPGPSVPSTPADVRQVPPPQSQVWEFDAADVLARIPRADLKNGSAIFTICAICHSVERDIGHRVGSNLWGILGRRKASYSDYSYSQALKAWGGTWTYEDMARFLYDTRTALPGSKMAFAGIRDPAKLADVIAFMRTLADKPVPLPPTR